MAAKQQKRADGEGGPVAKRLRETINETATEFLCPITSVLPLDPVVAEDGQVYEREAIESWFARKHTSPVTNKNIGTKLIPSTQVRNMIERMVRSGTITGDVADKWTKRIKDLDDVKRLRENSEKGDDHSMVALGSAYLNGKYGLPGDRSLAQQWFLKAAEKGNVTAYGNLGEMSCVPAMKTYWWTRAAEGGGEHGCIKMAEAFKEGLHGLPVNIDQAKAWLTKMKDAKVSDAGSVAKEIVAKLVPQLSSA